MGLLRSTGKMLAWLLVMLMGGLFLGAGVHGFLKAGGEYEPIPASVLLQRVSVQRGDPTTSSRNSWTVSVGLHYRYRVDGQDHQGLGTLEFGRAGSPSEAEALAEAARQRYQRGASIEVYVDRQAANRSTLEPPSVLKSIPVAAFGLLFVVFGLATASLAIADWWQRRRGGQTQALQADQRSDRWLNGLAIAFLVVIVAATLLWLGLNRPRELLVLLGPLVLLPVAWLGMRGRHGIERTERKRKEG